MNRSNKKLVVFGASGVQGRAQVNLALKQGYQVRAVTRTPSAFSDERYAALEMVEAEFEDTASLDRALDGVDGVLAQVPTMGDEGLMRGYLRNFADALARSGVPIIVFNVSMWAPREPCESSGYNFILETENILKAVGLPLIFLEPTLFMNNLQGNWIRETIIREGVFRYPHKPSMEANWVCVEDLAKVALAVVERPELAGRHIRVGGPERLRPADVVKVLSEVTGRPVEHVYVTPRVFAQSLWDLLSQVTEYTDNAGNMPRGREEEDYVSNIDEFYTFCNDSPLRPFLVDDDFVTRELGIELTTMKDWAKTQCWK